MSVISGLTGHLLSLLLSWLQRDENQRGVTEAQAALDAARAATKVQEVQIKAVIDENDANERALQDVVVRQQVMP